MEPAARVLVAVIGLLTIACGLYLLRLANAWRRKERQADEARPILRQERLYSWTRMNTVLNARVFCGALVLVGCFLVGSALIG
jgi:hypothetical protein